MSSRIPVSECRTCNRRVDIGTQTELQEVEPLPGDVSVCFYCMTIGVFDDDLKIVEPTLEQFERFAEDEDLQKSIKRMRALKDKYS